MECRKCGKILSEQEKFCTYCGYYNDPNETIDEDEDLLEVIRFGIKQFSIIILDQNLKKIGEALFPEYTYVPTAYFIREDGLYLSCSHFKNPDYSDDVLCFQKIELIGKE